MKNYFFRLASRSASSLRSLAFWDKNSSLGYDGRPVISSVDAAGIKAARILSTKVKCSPCLICSSIVLLLFIGMAAFSTKYVNYGLIVYFIEKEFKGEPLTCLDLPGDSWKNVPKCVEESKSVGTGDDSDRV